MNRETREEVLARLLAGALCFLKQVPMFLDETTDVGAREFVGEVDAFTDDCREFMATLVQTQWAPGEAPPGVEALQAEVKAAQDDVVAEERRVARNQKKAAARKASGRRQRR